jgi:hypothetical protein
MNKNYFLKIKFFLLILLLLTFFISCVDDPVVPPIPGEDSEFYESLIISGKIEMETFPTIGSFRTTFRINLVSKDPSLKVKKVQYDFSNDQKYDTTLTLQDSAKVRFIKFGYNKIVSSVYLEDNSVLSCSTYVWLTEPTVILANGFFFFEPNIYNGNFISVTFGPTHQAQFININTYNLDCFFCGYPSPKFDEMHISIPSFDGKKLLFDNGLRYRFCYYDLGKNDSTTVGIPLEVAPYPVGQITWSWDNKKIYGVKSQNFNLQGINSFDIGTNQLSTVYYKGDYICVVPNENDKLAILEKVNDLHSRLIIYNLSTNSIQLQYDSIPFVSPFRFLRNQDIVYFDGELALYSLSKKKTYFMQFDELNLSQHMYGEADIDMDGKKFVISTWYGNRALYMIQLPGDYY